MFTTDLHEQKSIQNMIEGYRPPERNVIDWSNLAPNPNVLGVMIQTRPIRTDWSNWTNLAPNPNTLGLLTTPLPIIVSDNDNWDMFFNPVPQRKYLDTEKMRLNCKEFARELAAYVFQPQRLTKLCETYNIEFEDYFEMV